MEIDYLLLKASYSYIHAPGKESKRTDDEPRGFARGLEPEKILGATKEPGELYLLIKWEGCDQLDLVTAKEANINIPQVSF